MPDVSYREKIEDAYCFVCENSMDWVHDSEKRFLRLQISQTNLDASSPIFRNISFPLEILLEDETDNMIHFDKFAFDPWGQLLYHSWRKYDKSECHYDDENGRTCDDRFHNDTNATKACEFGVPISKMASYGVFPRRIENNPAIKAIKENKLRELLNIPEEVETAAA